MSEQAAQQLPGDILVMPGPGANGGDVVFTATKSTDDRATPVMHGSSTEGGEIKFYIGSTVRFALRPGAVEVAGERFEDGGAAYDGFREWLSLAKHDPSPQKKSGAGPGCIVFRDTSGSEMFKVDDRHFYVAGVRADSNEVALHGFRTWLAHARATSGLK